MPTKSKPDLVDYREPLTSGQGKVDDDIAQNTAGIIALLYSCRMSRKRRCSSAKLNKAATRCLPAAPIS